jgi:hypothetical protein
MSGLTKIPPWGWYGLGMAAMAGVFALSRLGGGFVLPILLAGIAICMTFVSIGWRRSDEATKEAHKVAWWYGGNFGLIASLVLLLSSSALPGLRELVSGVAGAWHERLGTPGDSTLAAFALGAVFVTLCQTAGYLVIWTGWWIAKR